MFTFCSAKSRKLVFSEDDCHPTFTLYLFTNNGWSLGRLENTWQQFFFVSNKFMSSCVICLVIARDIFLLQSDCSATTKVRNFLTVELTLELTCFVADKTKR